jgi:hypothetical protein
MTRRDPDAGEPRFEVKATAETHFSWLRTRMSTERGSCRGCAPAPR